MRGYFVIAMLLATGCASQNRQIPVDYNVLSPEQLQQVRAEDAQREQASQQQRQNIFKAIGSGATGLSNSLSPKSSQPAGQTCIMQNLGNGITQMRCK